MRAAIFASVLAATLAAADRTASAQTGRERLELQIGGATGGPLGLALDPSPRYTTAFVTVRAHARLRSPRYTPLAVETGAVLGYGLGANLLVDVLRAGRLRVHIFDAGVFWSRWRPVAVGRVRRAWDLTLGAGTEVRVWRKLSVTLDWRTFLPNPYRVLTDYGDFSRLVYGEALKGGQTWLGASWSW
jgi:hypothetical protein